MKLSRYVYIVEKTPIEYIVACTTTRALISLGKHELDDLKRGDVNQCIELSKEQFSDCIDMGFLVPKNLDESRYSPDAFATYIALTTACNFKCEYCYEKGQVQTETLSEKSLPVLWDWYKKKLDDWHYKTCSIDLYGGEPLLFLGLVIKFLQGIQALTQETKVKLETRLITNGYLLTPEIIRSLLPFGLNEIHVTLDGIAESHNKRRPHKNGKGSFDTVFNNLIAVAQMEEPFEITCRISFDRSNIQGIPALLDLIKTNDPKGRIEPYFGSITQTLSQINVHDSFCSRNILDDQETADNFIYLYQQAHEKGFKIPSFFTLGPCMVMAEGAGVVTPDGSVYKCLDMIGNKELATGHISSEIETPVYYDFMVAAQLNKCYESDCPFVPICGGGCIMESYMREKDFTVRSCHRSMLEKIYNVLLTI